MEKDAEILRALFGVPGAFALLTDPDRFTSKEKVKKRSTVKAQVEAEGCVLPAGEDSAVRSAQKAEHFWKSIKQFEIGQVTAAERGAERPA